MNIPELTKTKCNWCDAELGEIIIMSWFLQELICEDCAIHESKIQKALPFNGKNFKGCGYIPSTKLDIFK